KAIRSGACKKRAWVMACFSVVLKSERRETSKDYPYRLFKIDDKLYFIDPENTNTEVLFEGYPANLTEIEDFIPNEPLFYWLEEFKLNPGDLVNCKGPEPLLTTAGNVLVNQLALCFPLGDIIPFQKGTIDAGKLAKVIKDLIVDDPEDD